ncbi:MULTISPECIES: hypothetical protein [Streptomyces]|uniref:hypothetical protein n=1 Tax=Streptomyces TaxID=1883 RepID=UPI00163D291E|nr:MULTISPECIES: hypothetical protein [Streptomyces]MBC2877501.1 hypothetical protein [Streptomyces sp. TYQ1024]UBI36254.1 hypothetical protein K7I03_07135 [Streptomyces mobaraensis]UKW28848.1 hypothetical protein MCU78_07120 [Streptomyces sp. TYQ1024]
MATQGIRHAFNLKKAKVTYSKDPAENAVVLVQNGSAGVGQVENGVIRWFPISLAFRGYYDLPATLGRYQNLPSPFNQRLETVFPDYDKAASITWATSGENILQFDWANDKVTKTATTLTKAIPGLPTAFKSGLTAAMGGTEGGKKPNAWLFKGKQCVRLSYEDTTFTCGTAVDVQRKWKLQGRQVPELAGGIDAALRIPGTDTGYFFVGDKYLTCDVAKEQLTAGPRFIRRYWHQVPLAYPLPDTTLCAAREGSTSYEWYLFLGKYAARIVDATITGGVPSRNSSNPPIVRRIDEHFPALKNTVFANGVDSAINYAGTCYLVKGGKIVKPYDSSPKAEDLKKYYGGSSRFLYPHWSAGTTKQTVYDLADKKQREFSPAATVKGDHEWQSKITGTVRTAVQFKELSWAGVPYLITEGHRVWLLDGSQGKIHKAVEGLYNWEVDWPDNPYA